MEAQPDQPPRRSRVSSKYQAVIPPQCRSKSPACRLRGPPTPRTAAEETEAAGGSTPVWSRSQCPLTEKQLSEYLQIAGNMSSGEIADDALLGVLHWNRYDVSRALRDLGAHVLHPNLRLESAREDTALLEKGMMEHGKAFDRIRLPGRDTAAVVRAYYGWKRVERQSKRVDRLAVATEPEGTAAHAAMVSSDAAAQTADRALRGLSCSNCNTRLVVDEAEPTRHVATGMCAVCLTFWQKWGRDRKPPGRWGGGAVSMRPPPGVEQLANLKELVDEPPAKRARGGGAAAAEELQQLRQKLDACDDRYQAARKRQAATREALREARRKIQPELAPVHVELPPAFVSRTSTGTSVWSNEEVRIVCEGLVRHGQDLPMIWTGISHTKSLQQLRNWFSNYRKKYALDTYLRQHEELGR